MKSGIVTVGLASVVIVAGISYAFVSGNQNPPRAIVSASITPDSAVKVVNVDELALESGNFTGEFVLRGVVAGVRETEGLLALIDSREFEACGVLTCADNTLPVRYAGPLPTPGTMVEVTGRIVRNERGLVINATQIQVVK